MGAHKCRILREGGRKRIGKRKILEGIPHIKRERIKDVAPSTTEETWN